MSNDTGNVIKGWLPYALGVLLVMQFAALGVWQISRALEKRADQQAFDGQSGYTNFVTGLELRPYQKLEASGLYDAARQFVLDNIVLNSRYGHYVVSPLRLGEDEPLLLVNRGWVERSGPMLDAPALRLPERPVTVRGRVGALPRAGYKMGDAIADTSGWPQHAVYPALDDLEASLGEPVQPFVLLLDPEEDFGLLRHWVPEEMGPGRHYAYAFQWFAMGAVLAGLLVWNYRKRGLET